MLRFPAALRRLRTRRGLLQKTIAHQLHLDPGQFCAVERGSRGPLDQPMLDRAAELLDLSVQERLELVWAARHDRLLKHAMREGASPEEIELMSLCSETLHHLREDQRGGLIRSVRKFNESAKLLAMLGPDSMQTEGIR